MLKGYFQGIEKTSSLLKPRFKETGRYLTVRYGWLSYFVLLVPESAEIKRVDDDRKSHFYIRMPYGETHCFKIIYGNAEMPDIGISHTFQFSFSLDYLEKEFPTAVEIYDLLSNNGINDQQLSISLPYFLAYILINENENLIDAIEQLERDFVEKTIFMLRKYYHYPKD
ncbi:MAG: hypothetical protein QXL06_06650 [Nitrososphaerota archaeon]